MERESYAQQPPDSAHDRSALKGQAMKTSKDGHYSSPISAIRRTGNVAPGCVEIQLHLLSQQLPGQHGCHFCCIVVDPMQGLRGAFAPQVICKMSVTSFKKEV